MQRRFMKIDATVNCLGVSAAHFVAPEKTEISKLVALSSKAILDSNTNSGHNGIVRAIIRMIYTLNYDLDNICETERSISKHAIRQ